MDSSATECSWSVAETSDMVRNRVRPDLFFSVSFTHYSVFAKFPKIVCLLKDTPHYFQNTHYNTPGGGRRDRGGQRPPSARNWRPKAANLLWIMAAEGRHDICLDAVSVKRQRGNAALFFAILPKLPPTQFAWRFFMLSNSSTTFTQYSVVRRERFFQ